MTRASEKLMHPDGRVHEEQGTAGDVEQKDPEVKENQRTNGKMKK